MAKSMVQYGAETAYRTGKKLLKRHKKSPFAPRRAKRIVLSERHLDFINMLLRSRVRGVPSLRHHRRRHGFFRR